MLIYLIDSEAVVIDVFTVFGFYSVEFSVRGRGGEQWGHKELGETVQSRLQERGVDIKVVNCILRNSEMIHTERNPLQIVYLSVRVLAKIYSARKDKNIILFKNSNNHKNRSNRIRATAMRR